MSDLIEQLSDYLNVSETTICIMGTACTFLVSTAAAKLYDYLYYPEDYKPPANPYKVSRGGNQSMRP